MSSDVLESVGLDSSSAARALVASALSTALTKWLAGRGADQLEADLEHVLERLNSAPKRFARS